MLGWTRSLALSALLLAVPSLSLQQPQVAFSSPPPYTPPASSYVPTAISSIVELGGALTRSTTTYTLAANGVPGGEWVVGVKGKEGFLEAWEKASGAAKKSVEVSKVGKGVDDITYYSLRPSPPSSDSTTTSVTLHSVLSHLTTPKPRALPQSAEALGMFWSADLLDPLAYLSAEEKASVEEVKVKVKTPTPKIVGMGSPDGFEGAYSKGGTTITFTSKTGGAGLEGPQVASVHYHQPEPVVAMKSLNRVIEVSHWGSNLAVMDEIDLMNVGPTLEGQFARIEHQKNTMQRRVAALGVTSLSIALPPRITSPYYYDIVGNVSTSRFRSSAPSTSFPTLKKKAKAAQYSQLDLVPRYPLMGGWNYTFTMGYDAPLGDYLRKRKNGEFVLAVPFLTAVPNVAVDEVKVEVRLPEAARNIRVHTPFPVDSLSFPTTAPSLFTQTEGYYKTYLDSTGRPTVVITKSNCGDRHGGDVIIEYTTSPLLDALQKPLAIASVLGTFYLVTIGARRMEWGIPK